MPTQAPSNQPLSEQTFFILLSLYNRSQHGYAILKDVKELSDGRLILRVSTLYTALKRLLEFGWIERIEHETDDEGGHFKKEYRLSADGVRILSAEAKRLQTLIQAANRRLPKEI